MSKKSRKPLQFRVTQPAIYSTGVADYPEKTTRMASNDRFILAANHPRWYEAAAEHEDGLLRLMDEETLRRGFQAALNSPAASTPFHAYGLVLLQLMGDYTQRNLKADPQVGGVFRSAVGTVVSNLAQLIFRDPKALTGDSYSAGDLEQWRRQFAEYMAEDRFVYRPAESGRDIDGAVKPVIELCPAPRLGRFLVEAGFAIIMGHMDQKVSRSK